MMSPTRRLALLIVLALGCIVSFAFSVPYETHTAQRDRRTGEICIRWHLFLFIKIHEERNMHLDVSQYGTLTAQSAPLVYMRMQKRFFWSRLENVPVPDEGAQDLCHFYYEAFSHLESVQRSGRNPLSPEAHRELLRKRVAIWNDLVTTDAKAALELVEAENEKIRGQP